MFHASKRSKRKIKLKQQVAHSVCVCDHGLSDTRELSKSEGKQPRSISAKTGLVCLRGLGSSHWAWSIDRCAC